MEDDGELLAGSFGILNRETSTTGVRFVATPPSVDVVVGFTAEFVVVVGGVLDVDDWEDEGEQDGAKQAVFVCRLVIFSLSLSLTRNTELNWVSQLLSTLNRP